MIIEVGTLRELTKNSVGPVPFECPIGLELVLEYPLVGDNIDTTRARNQVSSVVGHEGGIFFLHSRPPIRIGEGGLN
jgi:hypothetical protein